MYDGTKTTDWFLVVCSKSGGGFHGPCSSCLALYECARIQVDTLDANLDWCPALQWLPDQSGAVVPPDLLHTTKNRSVVFVPSRMHIVRMHSHVPHPLSSLIYCPQSPSLCSYSPDKDTWSGVEMLG